MAAAKSRWEKGLRRLRLALTGEADAADVLEQSRARIWNARQALERAAPPPRRRPFVQTVPSTDETDTDRRSYLVLILDPNGTVRRRKLLACDDDEAMARAHAQAEGCAFDVWDGLRFIEHFEPSVRAPEQLSRTTAASR